MSRVPGRKDFARRIKRSAEQQRMDRTRRRGHTESKTFIVGGSITIGLFIPPFFVAIDSDDETPEWKSVVSFRAQLEAGTATLDWLHKRGATVTTLASQEVTTNPAHDPITLVEPFDLLDLDTLQLDVTAASGPVNLAAAAFMVTAGG